MISVDANILIYSHVESFAQHEPARNWLDLGFDQIFSRQIEALGRPGDVAIAISTSDKSPNVIAGLRRAKAQDLVTAALSGKGSGRCSAAPWKSNWDWFPPPATERFRVLTPWRPRTENQPSLRPRDISSTAQIPVKANGHEA